MNTYIDNLPNEIVYHINSYLDPLKKNDHAPYKALGSFALCDKKRFELVKDYILNSKIIHLDQENYAFPRHIPAKKIKLKESKRYDYLPQNPRSISTTSVSYWMDGKICFKSLRGNGAKEVVNFPEANLALSHFRLNGSQLAAHVNNSPEITIFQPLRKKGKLLSTFYATTYPLPGIAQNEKVGKLYSSSADSQAILTFETETRTLHGFHLKFKRHIKIQLNSELARVDVTNDYFYYQQKNHSQLKIHFFDEISSPYTIHLNAGDSVLNFTNNTIYAIRKVHDLQKIVKINLVNKTESAVDLTDKVEGVLKIRPLNERYAVLIEIHNIQKAFHLRVLDFELGESTLKQSYDRIVKFDTQPQNDESLNSIQLHCGKDRLVYITELPRQYRDYDNYRYQVKTIKFKLK